MRFYASHVGSGLWGLYDGGVMTWLAIDLSENEAKQQAADRNVFFNQWGQREESERRQVSPRFRWSQQHGHRLGSWTTGSESGRSGGVGCADQTVIMSGSKLVIFGRQRVADSSVGRWSTTEAG